MKNKFEKIKYPVKELPSGDTLNINLFRITGERPGPHVHIQSSVHGAELQGNLVIFELMKHFSNNTLNGSITFIPVANPAAMNCKIGATTFGRFNPKTGNNWNRNYTDIFSQSSDLHQIDLDEFVAKNANLKWNEIKKLYKGEILNGLKKIEKSLYSRGHISEDRFLNLQLQKIASSADIILDLHTGPHATRYIYSAIYQKESVKDFKFPHTLLIPNEYAGAMDEACFMPWIHLWNKMKEKNLNYAQDVESYTIELGSEEIVQSDLAKDDAKRIIHFLSKKGLCEFHEELPLTNQYYCLLEDYRTYYNNKGGLIEFLKAPGEKFSKGDPLFKVLNFNTLSKLEEIEQCITTQEALADGIVINHCTSSSQASGSEIYQVMENWTLF